MTPALNAALRESGAGDFMLLIVVILMIFWTVVATASGILLVLWVREMFGRFQMSFLSEEEVVEGPQPVGFATTHTDEMGYVEYVDPEELEDGTIRQ